jgi:hypothetical protein
MSVYSIEVSNKKGTIVAITRSATTEEVGQMRSALDALLKLNGNGEVMFPSTDFTVGGLKFRLVRDNNE